MEHLRYYSQNLGTVHVIVLGLQTTLEAAHPRLRAAHEFGLSGLMSWHKQAAPWLKRLNSYIPFQQGTEQYAWFVADIAAVNRTTQPWLIVQFHVRCSGVHVLLRLESPCWNPWGPEIRDSGGETVSLAVNNSLSLCHSSFV